MEKKDGYGRVTVERTEKEKDAVTVKFPKPSCPEITDKKMAENWKSYEEHHYKAPRPNSDYDLEL